MAADTPRALARFRGAAAGYCYTAAKLMWGAALSLVFSSAARAGHPNLPTPCIAGNCGSAAQTFVQYGTAGAVVSGATLTVTQSTSKAILNWADFNIASGYTVNFIQPSTTAAVLNNIWSASPSVIAGSLKANGQVYLYDQNGIVFDNGAQVNAAGLTAATLALPNNLFENGILSANTPGMVPPPVFVAPPNGTPGAVSVNPGATLTASDGGRILLLGSAVTNRGQITAPDGQVILGAATKNVYLAASTDPSLRGLLIEVDSGGTSGTVTNSGEISAPRGNITLAGLIVQQQGMLSATTSVSENGSIYLVAGDVSGTTSFYNPNPQQNGAPTAFGGLAPNNGGTLILAPGSVTEILPDATDTNTVTVPQQAAFIPSEVDLAGRAVALSGNAAIHAPGGRVSVYAAANPYALISVPIVPPVDDGSIYLDHGSVIDVSGLTQVPVPATQNVIQVTLETNDLQNDPLLRNGFLHGTTVTVDVNNPPALFNVQPYADNIGANINEVLTKAGTIQLNSSGNIIVRSGSTLNVSGGSIAYQGGYGPATTNLLAANGAVYNISAAPNNIQYVAVANSYSYTDPTWGATNSGSAQAYYPGYTQGENAGSVTVTAPVAYLRGTMLADTVNGLYQRTPSSLALGGTFVLGCSSCTSLTSGPNLGLDGGVTFSDDLQDSLNGNIVAYGSVISATDIPANSLISATQLTHGGFNTISVSSNGPVVLPAGYSLSLAANGGVALKSGLSIDIAGSITGPGDAVSLVTVNTRDELLHNITVDDGAVVDVSGSWINDSPTVTVQPGTTPTAINGGSVSISAAGNVDLANNTLIDVSGGAWINQNNKITKGSAGSISLAANFSPDPSSPALFPFTGAVNLSPSASLLGASLSASGGGSLALQSGSVTVGLTPEATPGELLLAPGFFAQGGFANYKITGQNDLIIGNTKDTSDSAPIRIAPLQQTLMFTQNAFLQPTGSKLSSFTQLQALPAALRSPANVDFAASGNDPTGGGVGTLTLARDASIVTDPGASVTLAAAGFNGSVFDFGTVDAPAGTILLIVNPSGAVQTGADAGFIDNQQILLGPGAVLAAPAFANINTLNQFGYAEGSILPGGTVSLIANKGFIVTNPGSLINVSGTVGTIDVASSSGVAPTMVAGNAGTVNLEARDGLVLQGGLIGQAATLAGAAVSGAAAGTLNVVLGQGYDYYTVSGQNLTSVQYPTNPRVLTLVGLTADGQPAEPFTNQLLSGSAFINVGTLMSGGFDKVSVQSSDTIAFSGSVALHANAGLTLDAPAFVANPGSQTSLSAAYVALGNYDNNPDYFNSGNPSPNAPNVLRPGTGNGTLSVDAQLIDFRGISGWNGFVTENFSSSGDIRFVSSENLIFDPPAVNVAANASFEGALNTSAALNFQGAQLYPTTATGFAINDLPATGTIAAAATAAVVSIMAPSSTTAPATPLSAGGNIAINATDINQAGVLRAPLGEIALNGISIRDSLGNVLTPGSVTLASGSLTSVSADGLILPYGATANGTQWTYTPTPFVTNVLTAPPAKQISLTGAVVNTNSGAKVDLSGGGDLYAYEFIAGEGGSVDVLNPANLPAANHPAGTTVYSYAILPSLGSNFAPVDPQYGQGSPATTGQTITLSGVPGLPAGTYALLPAYYALLPGAYAVQVIQANSGIVAGTSVAQTPGSTIVAARFGNASAGTLDSLTSSVIVATDAAVRTQSQYTDSFGNAFFYSAAASSQSGSAGAVATPPLPADAGQFLVSASSSVTLNGTLSLGTGSFTSGTDSSGNPIIQQGRGGDVAIIAQNIVVVDSTAGQPPAAPGIIDLNVQQLNNLDAQTLILGASAVSSAAGQELMIGPTQTVELKNTTALNAPVVMLAAQDSVTVDPGAQLSACNTNGGSSPAAGVLLLPGGGALLRASSGPGATLIVDQATLPQNPTGIVTIGNGADVQATGSLLLYGTNTTTLATGAQIGAPAVTLFSSLVSLGDVPAGTAGLTINEQLLGSLKGLTELTLGSSSTINLFGTVQVGTASSTTPNLSGITFDSTGIAGYGSGDKVFQAANITLENSSGAAAGFVNTPDGTGALQLIATANAQPNSGQITIGSGNKVVSGFGAFNLQAAGDLLLQGSGTLTVASSSPVPLNITAAALIASSASSQLIATTGAVTISPSAANPKLSLPAPGLGATLAVVGSSIDQNGTIDLPAGSITLTAASGGVTLGKGSFTEAAGAAEDFTVQSAVAAGGSIALAATAGNATIQAGATVDVSGATSAAGAVSGAAGTLSISAPQGSFIFAGSTLKGSAASGQNQGNFSLDVGSGLSGTGVSELTTALGAGGFTGAVDLRTRGDALVSISNTVTASSFQLAADQGSIVVTGSGTIDTSGGAPFDPDGGSIALWAGTGLTLQPGAQLLANAGAAGPIGANGVALVPHGGNVTLGTVSGQILIAGGGQQLTTISMQGGGAADSDGTLTLRAPRTADGINVQVTVQPGLEVVSRNPVTVEGFKTYVANDLGSVDAGCGAGGSCDIADQQGMLFTDASTLITSMAALPPNLAALSNVQVRAGIEIDSPITATSNGDLVLDNSTAAWDLASWNAALGAPVNLTLRAAGNLVFESSLSDGFTNNGKAVAAWTFGEPTGAGLGSASYRLAAGADLTAANPLAVVVQPVTESSLGAPPNSGNVILTPGMILRTGGGNIAIAAGGDALLGYSFNGYDNNGNLLVTENDPLTAAIYTAGVPSVLTAAQDALFTPTNLSRHGGGGPNYPTDGGNVSVSAADDIRSAISAQTITDWLWRRASDSGTFAPNTNTSWWVMFQDFQQGIGALGGGDVSLTAGRDIVNSSAVIPTSGRLLVAAGDTPVASDLFLTGGGYLSVHAGGDIISGLFENDWGNAIIAAGGALRSSADSTFGQQYPGLQGNEALPAPGTEVYPILAVGNGVFDVSGAAGVAFVGVANSTTLPITIANAQAVQNEGGASAFYAYAPTSNPSTLNIISAGGTVTPNNDALANVAIVALSNNIIVYEPLPNPVNYLATYPSTLNVAALSGNINLGDPALEQIAANPVDITLFPAATGNLNLLAAQSINNNGLPYSIQMSEANPAAVPNALLPIQASSFAGVAGASLPLVPLHQSDSAPASLVAASGSIESGALILPRAANVIAGGNLEDVSYIGKNLNPSDVTLFEAGGDITYPTPTAPVTNQLLANSSGINVGGPGYVEVLAGGSINLGDGTGIVTSGNLTDPRLPSSGASIIAGAGFGINSSGGLRAPAYQAFTAAYLAPNAATSAPSAYASNLIAYMQQLDPVSNAGISYAAALSAFAALKPAQQLPLLAAVLSDELSATGLAHTLDGANYQRGYDAISTLFPTTDSQGHALAYDGNIDMFYSQLKTQQGGDISFLVPGGSIEVGVPNPPSSLGTIKGFTTPSGLSVPAAVNLGILVLAQGAVEGFVDQNVDVNQSRILTLEGGDIILWATNGNIDAGKGAKSASGAPPPTIQTDANGNSFVDPSNSISGSGIGQLLTVSGIKAGLVNLIAPKGTVNAGDAGIRVAGNLNIAAVQVIGASNITVAGTATGVPTSEAGAFAGALSGANSLADAGKGVADQLNQEMGSAANYQQLNQSLQPTFITVKMFCLGIECETN